MGKIVNNKKIFENGEGDKYFDRNIDIMEEKTSSKTDIISNTIINWLKPLKKRVSSICELGCGGGHRLNQICNELNASGYGIDPSYKAIKYIKKNFKNIKAKRGFGHDTRFVKKFDLVHLGFFLCWVDREYYLRCISEADRILNYGGFLTIQDFDSTPFQYKNKYHHKHGAYTYKMNNANTFVSTGMYTIVNKFTFDISKNNNYFFTQNYDNRVSITLLYKEKESFNLR